MKGYLLKSSQNIALVSSLSEFTMSFGIKKMAITNIHSVFKTLKQFSFIKNSKN